MTVTLAAAVASAAPAAPRVRRVTGTAERVVHAREKKEMSQLFREPAVHPRPGQRPEAVGGAAAALGQLRDPGAVDSICGMLARDDDVNARANACAALGQIGDPRSEPYLRGAENDRSEFVAGLAREALTRVKKGR